MAIGVPHSGDHLIFVPVGWQPTGAIGRECGAALCGTDAAERLRLGCILDRKRHLRVVAAEDEQSLAVWRKQDVVGAMLAGSVECAELFHGVERIVAVGIGHAV